jgi:hypothetical protein
MLSSEEPADYVRKLKQTVQPLANIAAYNSNLKAKISPSSDGSNYKKIYVQKKTRFLYFILI